MSGAEETRESKRWSRARELPLEAFEIWRKSGGAIKPVAIVATVDPDGAPRTAPFGSVLAVTPRLLRLCCLREHDTYANLCRDPRVTVALVSSPDISVSARGRARVARERMEHDERFAVVDIDIEEVKNDMTRLIVIEGAITFSVREEYRSWHEAAVAELGAMA